MINLIPTPAVDFATYLAAGSETRERYFPGPTGQFCAAETSGDFFLVMAAADGRRTGISWSKWLHFWGWTASGRFAFFERTGQYGNRLARLFDTAAWKAATFSPKGSYCFGSMSGTCQRGLAAIAPLTERVLLADGQLVALPDMATRQVMGVPAGGRPRSQSTSFCFTATMVASVRLVTPILDKMLLT